MKKANFIFIFLIIGLLMLATAKTSFATRTPPTVSIVAPGDGKSVAGNKVIVSIAFWSKEEPVVAVDLYIDGILYIGKKLEKPVSEGTVQFAWDTTTCSNGKPIYPNGPHTLAAQAIDSSGLSGSCSINVLVNNAIADTIPPTVKIYKPLAGSVVSGITDVAIEAKDNIGISWVQLSIDNVFKYGSNVLPYIYRWDTSKYVNGPHTLFASAVDLARNEAQSPEVIVTVNNPGGPTVGVAKETPPEVKKEAEPSPPAQVPPTVAKEEMKITEKKEELKPVTAKPETPKAGSPEKISEKKEITKPLLKETPKEKVSLPPSTKPLTSKRTAPEKGKTEIKPSEPKTAEASAVSVPSLREEKVTPPETKKPLTVKAETKRPEVTMGKAKPAEREISKPGGIAPEEKISLPTPTKPIAVAEKIQKKPEVRPSEKLKASKEAEVPEEKVAVPQEGKPVFAEPKIKPLEVTLAEKPLTKEDYKLETAALKEKISPPVSTTPLRVTKRAETKPERTETAKETSLSEAGPAFHIVKSGETLDQIAQRYGLSVGEIAEENKLKDASFISAGQKLALPKMRSHKVKPGEYLEGIGKKYGVSWWTIAKINQIKDKNLIASGQELIIPMAQAIEAPAAAAKPEKLKEPLEYIATKHGIVARPISQGKKTLDVFYDGWKMDLNPQAFIRMGTSLAPFREIFEYAGGRVNWVPVKREIKAFHQNKDIWLKIGYEQAKINDKPISLSVAPFIMLSRTIVPIRFFEDALDVDIQWNPETGDIYITSKE